MRHLLAALVWTTLAVPTLTAQFVFASPSLEHFPNDGLVALKSSVADLDGDGDLDAVITGSIGTSTLQRFYRNNGQAVFEPNPSWPDIAEPSYHLVADIDSDGDDDVLLSSAIVRNLGGGVLQVSPMPATGWPLVCADFDGDGQRDLFTRSPNGLSGALYRQVGGTFVSMSVPTTNILLREAAGRDFDGDGDIDLLLTAAPYVIPFSPNWPGQDRLWRNNGAGQFTEQYLPGAANADTPVLAVADFDNDGDTDCAMLASNGLFAAWQVRLNDGTGNLVITPGLLPPNVPTTGLWRIDLDSDGDQDLVGLKNWYANDGSAQFSTQTYGLDELEVPLQASGDFDGDGDPDLIAAGGSWPRLLLHVGTGRFANGSRRPWQKPGYGGADFDGDGDIDLLGGFNPASNGLGINDGTGWYDEVPFPWPAGQAQHAQIADFDGDGDRDVVAIFSPLVGAVHLRLFRNNGNATFVDTGLTAPGPTVPNLATAMATLDADGDGDRDLVVTVRQGGVLLFANNGSGTFAPVANAFPAYAGWLRTVAVGDLDADGDVDVLTGDESYGAGPASQLHYFANNGAGVFADVSATRLQAPVSLTREVVLADVDADGDLDAFAACWGTASYPSSLNLLLTNDGSGNLTYVPSALPNALPTGSVALADFDVDGDLDAVVGTYYTGVRFWRNQGGATFVDVGGMFPPPSTVGYSRFVVADLDDDLDPDLLLGDQTLFNQHWSASRSRLGRIGQLLPYSLQTRTAATAAVPFFGVQFARVPLPPFGTLAMPSGSPVLLPPLVLTGGSAQVAYPIPYLPAVIGLELVMQSLFVGTPVSHLSPAVRFPLFD